MKTRILCLGAAALALAGLSACQLRAPGATPTAVVAATVQQDGPAPTNTPAPPPPTVTVPPTPLPTALPTLTLAVTATPDPNEGVGEVVFADRLDGLSGWGWGYQEAEAVTFSTAGGQLDAVMVKPNIGPRYTVSPDSLNLGDQQIRFTARANLCYERDEYGLAFRTNGTDSYGNPNGYVLKLSCAGQVRLEALRAGQAAVLADWTSAPAIVGGAPAENRVLVWARGSDFRVYVNDKYVLSAVDSSFASGAYAFFLRDRTNGGASFSFSGLEVRAIAAP